MGEYVDFASAASARRLCPSPYRYDTYEGSPHAHARALPMRALEPLRRAPGVHPGGMRAT